MPHSSCHRKTRLQAPPTDHFEHPDSSRPCKSPRDTYRTWQQALGWVLATLVPSPDPCRRRRYPSCTPVRSLWRRQATGRRGPSAIGAPAHRPFSRDLLRRNKIPPPESVGQKQDSGSAYSKDLLILGRSTDRRHQSQPSTASWSICRRHVPWSGSLPRSRDLIRHGASER